MSTNLERTPAGVNGGPAAPRREPPNPTIPLAGDAEIGGAVSAAAREAIDAGICVVPARTDGSKRPFASWKALQARRSGLDDLARWQAGILTTGLGWITGAVSGDLEMLELDEDFYEGFRRAAEAFGIGDVLERIEAGCSERTPGGGVHLFYRCPAIQGNTDLAKRPDPGGRSKVKVLIQTRGEGGFVVVSPSGGTTHPTGRPYVRMAGGPTSIAAISAEERESLFRLARTFDRMPVEAVQEPRPRGRPRHDAGRLRPGDDYNARATWQEVLSGHGWQLVYARGDTGYWRRPGKDDGWSATTNHNGSDVLWVFTSSSVFEAGKSYTKVGAYTVLNHGGEWSPAIKSLAAQGYGEQARPGAHTRGHPPATVPLKVVRTEGEDESRADPDARKPAIEVTHRMAEVIDLAVAAISADPTVFQRNNLLVRVLRDNPARRKKGPRRAPGTPTIGIMPKARLHEVMASSAEWWRPRTTPDGQEIAASMIPPTWAVAGVEARGEYAEIRPLEGIIEAPAIRPDGSILDRAGWDEQTGLILEPAGEMPTIPDRPTRDDARAAARILWGLVRDFPFQDNSHRAAWLAALLTVLARHAIDGPVPLFLFNGNTPGVGKSKLCDIIAIVASMRQMARVSYPEQEEEMAKLLLAAGLAGDTTMMFDNVQTGQSIGGKSLDAVLTAGTAKGRILGKSEMTREVPVKAVFFATGSNLGIKGDALRRIVCAELRTSEERPEERSGFAIEGDILEYVRENRPRLLGAALTIVRAYFVADRPAQGLRPMDYVAWSRVVRDSIHWATGFDPCGARDQLIANDPEANFRVALVEGWSTLGLPDPRPDGYTAAEALKMVFEGQKNGLYGGLHECLMELSHNGFLPSSRAVGKRLAGLRGRNIGGKAFKDFPLSGICRWRVVTTEPSGDAAISGRGFSGSSGFVPAPTHEKPENHLYGINGEKNISGADQTHETHQTHGDDEREEITL